MAAHEPLSEAFNLSRSAKRGIVVVIDAGVAILAVWIAFYLRLGDVVMIRGSQWIAVLGALGVLPIFWTLGLYRAIFRFFDWEAMMGVARACALYGLLYATAITFLGVEGVPRTIGLIQPALLFLGMCTTRALARSYIENLLRASAETRVCIYGAGSAGRQLAAAIARSDEMQVIAYVDDDPTLVGSVLNGHRIYHPRELARVVPRLAITDILLAIPSASRSRRREIVETLQPLHVKVRTLPGLMDIAHGRVQSDALRELDIEDLLGRDPALPNQILFARNILGKTVLVTGAGGSIGSELCRQILAARPRRLILVDSSEFALYAIDQDLRGRLDEERDVEVVPLLASARDEVRMMAIMQTWSPHTVYHAAAYKHVPLVEYNLCEGVLNNVFGTLVTAQAALAAGTSDFVLISTDKAVRPTNAMGASKRLAELVLQAMAETESTMRLSMVRFGNVLGSSGSVVPLFRRQLATGGPLTVTDSQVTRYFMTIPEAAQLVIQAGAMAGGGDVFILNMGEPVRIIDLARKMIELSGLTVREAGVSDGDVAIEIVGLRPGEKLYEELLIGDNPSPTAHPLIMRAREAHIPFNELLPQLDGLRHAIDANEPAHVQAIVRRIVPEYVPSSELADLGHLARAS